MDQTPPIIRTQTDIDQHDHCEPAYLEIRATMVRAMWYLQRGLYRQDELGDLFRSIELLLACTAEPDVKGMLSAARGIDAALIGIVRKANEGGPRLN